MSFDLVRPVARPILQPVFEFASALSDKPKLVTPPVVYGQPWVGHQLITTAGIWTGQPAPAVTYEWLKDGAVIPNEDQAIYNVQMNDIGSEISSRITCTNVNGTGTASSNKVMIVVQRNTLKNEGFSLKKTYENNDRSVSLKEGAFAISTASQMSGKAYYEVVVDSTYHEGNTFIGVSSVRDGIMDLKGYIVYHQGKLIASIPVSDNNSWQNVEIHSGDIIGVSVDLDNCDIGFSVNGFLKGTQRVPNIKDCLPISAFVGSQEGMLNSIRYTFHGEKSEQIYKPKAGYTDWIGQPINECVPVFADNPTLPSEAFNDDVLTPVRFSVSACPPPQYKCDWYVDDTLILDTHGMSYRVPFEHIGKNITCEVIAINDTGHAIALTNRCKISRKHVAPVSKTIIRLETAESENYAGELYTVSESEWEGYPEPVLTYQWSLDNKDIEGANGTSYLTSKEDFGKRLMCKVTGKNSKFYYSIYTAKIKLLEPLSVPYTVETPELSAGDQAGTVIRVTKGKWKGNPIPVIEYSWFSDGTRIPNEITDTYTTTILDIGASIHAEIVATNSQGIGTAILDPVKIRKADKLPHYSMAPIISGEALIGSKLTTTLGIWTGNPEPTLEVMWYKDGEYIKNELDTSYEIRRTDLHSTIAVKVKATNRVGSVIAQSVNKVAIQSSPRCLKDPVIRSSPKVGNTIVPDTGVWDGTPFPYIEFQWLVDNEVVATNAPFTPRVEHIGKSLVLSVFGKNAHGGITANSEPAVITSHPIPIEIPKLSGDKTLSVTDGEWIGYPEPTFKYEWFRDNHVIPNAKESTYKTVDADIGHKIVARVRASNSVRASISDSEAKIIHSKPLCIDSPHITVKDNVATVTDGIWLAYPKPVYTYQWIEYGDSNSLDISADMIGKAIACRVTATNSEGSTSMTVAQDLIQGAPVCDIPPFIVCNDNILSVLTGKWYGYPYPQFSYVWSRNGVPLPNEYHQDYLVLKEDAGHSFSVRVVAYNKLGEVVVNTDPYIVYKEPIKLSKEFYTVSFQDSIHANITYSAATMRVLDALQVDYNANETSVYFESESIVNKPANIIYAVAKKNVPDINIEDILEFITNLKVSK